MSYETQIPDDFTPPQYIDEKFHKAYDAYHGNGHRPGPQWVVAIPRPDCDPSSRVHYRMGDMADYNINAKTAQVAMLHVLAAGKGRVRLGYREQVQVAPGDLVAVNLREAGHWIYVEGILCYFFTAEVAMFRMYRTEKPELLEGHHGHESIEAYAVRRSAWQDQLFWNIRDVLNDYVLLGRDPQAEREYRNGVGTRIHIPGTSQTDGTRSDNARDNRFPVVYRRVLGVGPGRGYRREDDLGFPEYVHSRSEASPGDMLVYSRNVRAAEMQFQGSPFEIIHAASAIDWHTPRGHIEVHESCATPIPWDVPNEADGDEDDALKGLTG